MIYLLYDLPHINDEKKPNHYRIPSVFPEQNVINHKTFKFIDRDDLLFPDSCLCLL